MEDLQLVRDLRPESPLPHVDKLAGVRTRLAVAMSQEPVAEPRLGKPALRPRRVRRFALAWATAGLAAAIAGVVVVAPDQIGGPTANAEAAEVLHRAAVEALELPDVTPRPDQFVYFKDSHGSEMWRSVDGTRDGQQRGANGKTARYPGCRDGRRTFVWGEFNPHPSERPGKATRTEPCRPDPAYLPDLPADADAMLAHLNKNRSGEAGDSNAVGKYIAFLLSDHYLPPRSKAALFRAGAKVPGLKVVKDVKDAAGRPGVGIAWSNDGFTDMIVFDAETYAYLGIRAGQGASAVVEVVIVDKVGQRP